MRPIVYLVNSLEHFPVNSWRRICFVYFVALTIGMHWPRLTVPIPVIIPIDKLMHAFGFAGFTGLLMLSRVLPRLNRAFRTRNIWLCAVIALAIGMTFELTQQQFVPNRYATWQDFIANLLGVLSAAAAAHGIFAKVPYTSTIHPNDGVETSASERADHASPPPA